MEKYRWCDVYDELPDDWEIDREAEAHRWYYAFIKDGKSPLKVQKRALLRVITEKGDVKDEYL